MMSDRPITHSQIREKLINNYGIEVNIRDIEREMWTLTDIFPTRIEVDDSKNHIPINYQKIIENFQI